MPVSHVLAMTVLAGQEAGNERSAADFGRASHELAHDVNGQAGGTGGVAVEFGEAEAWVEGVDDDGGGDSCFPETLVASSRMMRTSRSFVTPYLEFAV